MNVMFFIIYFVDYICISLEKANINSQIFCNIAFKSFVSYEESILIIRYRIYIELIIRWLALSISEILSDAR